MESEKFFKSDILSIDVPSQQIDKVTRDVYHNADFSEWAKRNKSLFLTVLVLLILFIVANILYFIFDPNAIFAILTLLFFFNFSILSFLLYPRKKWKRKTTLLKDKTIINMADHIVKS
ncbi:hypothetical protein B0I21_1168 [Sphingobacterium paludis]|uniref:Uncharacterized protein n=1 Tax=Sphingobacterium paludis TaxID=1476465 RepID=A0A4R7CRC1_9SPHI|nr:hypothetical protein B0I21_1168 [Sphingobacterium paludis]